MDPKQDEKKVSASKNGPNASKKVYAEPKLTVHGKVEDITKNILGGSGNDGLYGSSM